MFELMTIIRKRPEVSTEEFRAFMEHEYGPTYVAMPQTRSYTHYYLEDLTTDGIEAPVDAIVQISFDSEQELASALSTPSYRDAAERRKAFMQETSRGIHPTRIAKTVRLV